MKLPTAPVLNIHSRVIDAPVERLGELIDDLGGPLDRLWPVGDWMPIRVGEPVAPGAPGGHGFATYEVVGYEPGRWIRFDLEPTPALSGFHEFLVSPASGGRAKLQHVLAMRIPVPLVPLYPLVVKPVHDDVLRMILDRAELECTGVLRTEPAGLGPWTRTLRPLLSRAGSLVSDRDRRADSWAAEQAGGREQQAGGREQGLGPGLTAAAAVCPDQRSAAPTIASDEPFEEETTKTVPRR